MHLLQFIWNSEYITTMHDMQVSHFGKIWIENKKHPKGTITTYITQCLKIVSINLKLII